MRYDIVDSHLHYTDFRQKTDGFPALMQAMDKAGVSQTLLFGTAMTKQWSEGIKEPPTYYLTDPSPCYYYSGTDFLLLADYERQPREVRDRVFPFVCGVNPNDRFAVDQIDRLMELYPNTICGIGELMSRHDDLTSLTYGPAPHVDHPAFLAIYDYAAAHGLPVLVHHNITRPHMRQVMHLGELEAALAHNRDCKIIWPHIGISRYVMVPGLPEIADRLLRENPNLWIDISWVVYDYYFLDECPEGFQPGTTLDTWVDLLERWPDRFLLGTDVLGHWQAYPQTIAKYYKLLDRLTPPTARAVCHDNVLGLIKRYDD